MANDFILGSQSLTNIIQLIGIWSIFVYAVNNLTSLFQLVSTAITKFIHPKDQKSIRERYGDWAVITGSTDGIGRRYAIEYAKQGINIVLISRTESKLIQVAKEIETKYSVRTKYIVADFGNGESVYPHIERELDGIPVGILVNNVGTSYDDCTPLESAGERNIWNIIYTNIAAATFLTRLVIPIMKRNNRGAIVNVSSASYMIPFPLEAVYAATKAYITNFSRSIKLELQPHKNITVQLITPSFTRTKLLTDKVEEFKVNPFITDVKPFVKSAVHTLGRTPETSGYWWHGMQMGFLNLFPRWFTENLAHTMILYLEGRRRQLRGQKIMIGSN